MISIEKVLLNRFFIVAVGLVTVLALLHQWWARSFFLEIQKQQLTQEAHAFENHLSARGVNHPDRLDLVLPNHSGHIYIVSQAGKSWSSAPEAVSQMPLSQWLQNRGYFDFEHEDGRRYFGLVEEMPDGRQIVVLQDVSQLLVQVTKSHSYMVAIALLAVILLLYLQRTLIRNAFSHLDRLIKEIELLHKGETPRLAKSYLTETAPLASAINRLLGYLDNRSKRSRHAVGDLSHAMKTPLAVIRQIAERDDSGLSERDQQLLLQQADQLSLIIERELKRARIAGPGSKSELFSITAVVGELLETIQLIYPHKALQVQDQISDYAVFPGDRSDFTELMGNLLDNAGKWCGQQVRVSIEQNEQRLLIEVSDDGPGSGLVDPSDLLQRGKRLDEATEGHGLGLNIVAAIVQQYEGTIELRNDPELGGLQVTIEIPFDAA